MRNLHKNFYNRTDRRRRCRHRAEGGHRHLKRVHLRSGPRPKEKIQIFVERKKDNAEAGERSPQAAVESLARSVSKNVPSNYVWRTSGPF